MYDSNLLETLVVRFILFSECFWCIAYQGEYTLQVLCVFYLITNGPRTYPPLEPRLPLITDTPKKKPTIFVEGFN